ncbi:response regulator transcription factor [Telmatospirillum sp.]|uniref:response regulator transcription factor n=1 Tax=Telmatospirillum sp. TaxID=2079197 RepID=UPI002850FE06|nr:response regulator transcription factor [Telmatospirillum sp.]MDR3439451.1 response regulator transcription factor [Telmatospirillum sp.]
MSNAAKTRLVLVDDDELLRAVLAGNLTQAGYDVCQFTDPKVALASLRSGDVSADLLILDWRMPGMSGLELLQLLREAGNTTAALFFTSHNDILFEEAALAFGAVDFIDKTRSFAILQKRIELILTRADQTSEPPAGITSGALALDSATHTALWKGRRIDLTFGEFRVVSLLVEAGRDVTYREIYDALRGENFVAGEGAEGYRANVRALIKRLREKFVAVDADFTAIANYPGFGYRWQESDPA